MAPEVLIEAFLGDWTLLARCLGSSALLFLTGYAVGSLLGFATGLLMGWSRRADYWLHPLLQTIGPVPAASLLPLAVLILPTTYASAAFIVAFGAWFPMATMTRAGVRAVPRSYFDVARTLGANGAFLVRRIAIPAALPDMLTGLFTGLGTSLAALMTAELVGVDQGLAWYINWVKGWADYPRMYVGLTVLIVFCRALMILLFKLRSSLLAWQQNLVRW
ncbi:ABC transporter permease [Actinomyces ruminis]|uniref:ABC transporter permease n=1 Tax=Actinomyces ruminis TaxID=1937003 RepID=UPI00211E8D2D|nr:ABC transporter permease subunit [Actinomyces ruminis]